MSLLLDTSVVIPYLANVAYNRFVRSRLIREQVYIASVSGLELLAGSLSEEQRHKADAFLNPLIRYGRLVTPGEGEWLRAGRMIARFQNRFGHLDPSDHENDILILLAAARTGAELATENGDHFRTWSRFLPPNHRPRLVVLERQEYLNQTG